METSETHEVGISTETSKTLEDRISNFGEMIFKNSNFKFSEGIFFLIFNFWWDDFWNFWNSNSRRDGWYAQDPINLSYLLIQVLKYFHMSAAKTRAFFRAFNAHVSEASPLDFQCLLIDADHSSAFFKAIKGDSLLHFAIFH